MDKVRVVTGDTDGSRTEVVSGDLKLDHVDGVPTDEEVAEYERAFPKTGPNGSTGVLLLMADSTNVENEGFALPEIKVHQGLDRIEDATGRVVLRGSSSVTLDGVTQTGSGQVPVRGSSTVTLDGVTLDGIGTGELPAIQGVGFAVHIPASQLASHEQHIRADPHPLDGLGLQP